MMGFREFSLDGGDEENKKNLTLLFFKEKTSR